MPRNCPTSATRPTALGYWQSHQFGLQYLFRRGEPPPAPVSSGSTSSSQPPQKKGALSQLSNSLTQVIDTILVQVESLQDALITALEEAFGIVEDALRGISNLVEGEIKLLVA